VLVNPDIYSAAITPSKPRTPIPATTGACVACANPRELELDPIWAVLTALVVLDDVEVEVCTSLFSHDLVTISEVKENFDNLHYFQLQCSKTMSHSLKAENSY
jgi:hypothetical protein